MKVKKKIKIKIPFWLEIALILMVGVIISGVVVMSSRNINSEKYLVKFAYQDGTVIDTKECEKGKGVLPPNIAFKGVFRGWSGALNNISADIEVHPNIYTGVEDNLFYHNSVYVKEGKSFSIDILVGGNVNLNSGEISVEYDTDVMKFKGSNNFSGVNVEEKEPGKIKIVFDMNDNLTEEMLLSKLKFKSIKADAYSSELLISADRVNLISDGKVKTADFATINNNIYFLQEVSK